MDTPNAFIGHTAQPTPAEVSACLGATAAIWQKFVDWAKAQDVTEEEWNSFSPKYGWSFRLKRKKRTIIHMGPCNGCFRAGFILGDRAVAAARQSSLPKRVLKALEEARRYTEGTGLSVIVKKESDLAAVRKLVEIKLAN